MSLQQEKAPLDNVSATTSSTHVSDHEGTATAATASLPRGGEGESAIPEDKIEDKIEDKEDDWEHDPINPRNWSTTKKWTATILVSYYTFVTPLASSMMAPGLPDLAIKYGITNPTLIGLTLSIFLLSFAIGPLFLAPLSEMYGRVWVLHIGNIVFLAFNLGCALSQTSSAFIVFRFLSGFAGSAPIACGGGVIGDLFSERDRASAMALYSIGPLIGPAIGPVAGGWVAQELGIQYVFYIIVGLCGAASILAIPFLRETYAPVIRLRRDKSARDPEAAAAAHPNLVLHHTGKWQYLWINLSRPVILLTQSFICFVLSLYMALMYGIYYLMFATFPDLFSEVYHFSIGMGGLAYIGLGLGFLLATIFGAKISDQIYLHLANKNGGKGKPEMRVPALIFGSFFVPIGLFWYGWSAQGRVHWIMPIIGTGIFGFGLMTTFLPIQLYLVDAFTYAASALAAASVFRSILGFAFPLFGEQMFAALGYGGGNSLLAGLAIVIGIPFPVWIYFAGERIRAKSTLTR
ncbi:MFS general substrate transporter [Leucogyrophana mollusca]|uniref:MFS general substrate transporter n=1 Tax=Leucogyrophana mollusca TaxID=85980 RepID=A0ACB8BGV7_9AGAM|nr:MFS general substrate transporter [Leucogyrophana mollusca]